MKNLIEIFKKVSTKTKIICSNLVYSFRLKQWINDNGDGRLRVNYDLDKESIIFDVGGYLGDWVDAINSRYKSHIFVFEPVKKYYEKIVQRFSKDPNIKIFNFGLGKKDAKKIIFKMDNSSSFYKNKPFAEKENCKIMDIENFIHKNNIKKVNLIKINIEGGEFDLLEKIVKSNLVSVFENLQIQFHRFIPDAIKRRKRIHEQLSQTHFLTYNYPFI